MGNDVTAAGPRQPVARLAPALTVMASLAMVAVAGHQTLGVDTAAAQTPGASRSGLTLDPTRSALGAPATTKGCAPRPGRLGVSRVVEIDSSGGPGFGLQQYRAHDFLRDKEVVLTFDDGPSRVHTRRVVAALSAHCTLATFFMVGRMAISDPRMVREVARQGHTVALHTWSHRNLRAIGFKRARYEFEFGLSTVQVALGVNVAPFFRFPYLADSGAMRDYLGKRNIAVFSIDVDSKDFATRSPQRMQQRTLSRLRKAGKGILLFHDIQTSTARGIGGLLNALAAGGYKVVHLVPKTKASSMAQYDALAAKEFARRNKVLRFNPTARKAVVWPLQDPPAQQVSRKTEPMKPPPGSSAAPSTSKNARVGGRPLEDWRRRVFND